MTDRMIHRHSPGYAEAKIAIEYFCIICSETQRFKWVKDISYASGMREEIYRCPECKGKVRFVVA